MSCSSSGDLQLICTRFVLLCYHCIASHNASQKNARWEESIALSKQDKLYKDTMITAASSSSTEVAEELLSYFVDIGNKECFSAMLYISFDLLREDVVEELSWQHALNDFVMPYKIQKKRTLIDRVSDVFVLNYVQRLMLEYCSSLLWRRRSRSVRRRRLKRSSKRRTSLSLTLASTV